MPNIIQLKLKGSHKIVLLGPTVDNRLTFNDQLDLLCSAANYKLHKLRKIRRYFKVAAKHLYKLLI